MKGELKKQSHDLEKEVSNYYILIIMKNVYWDKWDYPHGDTIYKLLGYMTEEQAKQYEKDHQEKFVDDVAYCEEVSEYEYNLYRCWLDLENLLRSSTNVGSSILKHYYGYIELLTDQISNIKDELRPENDSIVESL